MTDDARDPDAKVITEQDSSVETTQAREEQRKRNEDDAAQREATEQQAAESQADPRTPEEIREDIRQTRVELGDTVEALAAKSDVKARAAAKVEQVKDRVTDKTADLAGQAQQRIPGVGDQGTSGEPGAQPAQRAQAGIEQLTARVRENPVPIAIGIAVLVGFLLGRRRSR